MKRGLWKRTILILLIIIPVLFTFLFRKNVRKSLVCVFKELTLFAGYISAKSNEEESYHHDEIVIFPDKIDDVFNEHTDGKKKLPPVLPPPTQISQSILDLLKGCYQHSVCRPSYPFRQYQRVFNTRRIEKL